MREKEKEKEKEKEPEQDLELVDLNVEEVGVNWGKILNEMHSRHLATECNSLAQMREHWKVLAKPNSCVWNEDWPGKKWDPHSVPKGTKPVEVRNLEERHAKEVESENLKGIRLKNGSGRSRCRKRFWIRSGQKAHKSCSQQLRASTINVVLNETTS